ncbi:MAG: general secretion pathway protein GspE [Deltaproteobacteria bacterium]|nr:general secretion pathway protein GspE [Deltaproteobacteria bacterium]
MRIQLGQLLLRAKVVTEAQLETALAEQEKWGGKLGQILVRMGYLSEDLLTKALSKQLGIPRVDLDQSTPSPNALRKVKVDVAEGYAVLPLELRDEGKTLLVAMSDPQNIRALDELRAATGCRIDALLAGETEIRKKIGLSYSAEELRDAGGDEFKITDAQGNTVMKKIEDIVPPSAAREPPPPPIAEPPPPPIAQAPPPPPPPIADPSDPVTLLEKVERTQRKEVQILKALVELLIERGVFTRDEYLAKVSKR